MPLTVMTYNIKTGGGDRLSAITKVIVAQRPDILGLQELRSFDRSGGALMRRLATDIGMRPFLARSWLGQPVAVLVREPASVTSAAPVRRPFNHAAQQLAVETDRGPLTVISTHLCPHSGRRRQWEARWLAGRVDRRRMTLLMGDLNTLDPWTDHAERLSRLPQQYRSRHVVRGGAVDSRAIQVLAAAGLVDLFASTHDGGRVDAGEKDYTAPTEHGGGEEFSRMRLDYILGTPQVAALTRSCSVVWGGETEWASDHYPLVSELDVEAHAR